MSSLVISFDNLNPHETPKPHKEIPNGYEGFEWTNFDFVSDTSKSKYANAQPGFANGTTSGHEVATIGPSYETGHTVSMDGTFTFKSVEITAVEENATVYVSEYRDGTYLGEEQLTVSSDAPTLFKPNWSNVDKIVFVADDYSEGAVLDDLTLSHIKPDATATARETASNNSHLDAHPSFVPLHGAEHLAIV